VVDDTKRGEGWTPRTQCSSGQHDKRGVDAALKAKALELARGARAKRVRQKINTKIPSRKKLGIATVEHQICKDGMHRAVVQTGGIQITDCSQISLDKFVKGRPHSASTMGGLRSNKRLRKPN
jgi:hypothetical protein